MTALSESERPDAGGPLVRLHSFMVPVRMQGEFLAEFDALLTSMRGARGFLGEETFLGGRNPRHVMLLSAWASKRACEAFFEAAAAPALRRRVLFKYLEGAEFFRTREPAALLALTAARRARAL